MPCWPAPSPGNGGGLIERHAGVQRQAVLSTGLRMTMRLRRKRLAVIAALGGALVAAALFYQQFVLARPIGGGPAGPAVVAEAFASVWTERPVRLLGLGDSITAGLGAASPDHSYFMRLVRNPPDEYDDTRGRCLSRVLPNLTWENLAVSGSNSIEHLRAIDERLKPHDPDVFGLVVLTTGGNGIIHWYGLRPPQEGAMYVATLEQDLPWIDAFRRRLGEILDRINAAFPGGCEIYLADIYDPTDGTGDDPSVYLPDWPDGLAIHARYNEVIAECAAARPNVHVVPLRRTFLGHGAKCRQFWRSTYVKHDPHYWYFDNVEDPNDRGYDVIRRTFLNVMLVKSALRHGDPPATGQRSRVRVQHTDRKRRLVTLRQICEQPCRSRNPAGAELLTPRRPS